MDEMNNNGMEQDNVESYSDGTVNAPQGGDKKGMAIASLVLGIVSIVFSCAWYLAIPAAIVGLFLGVTANKAAKSGMTTAGIVLSVIGLIIAVIWVVVVVIIGVGAGVLGSM